MVYLSQFEFPDKEREYDFILAQQRTCYDTYYPFGILSEHGLRTLNFEPVTILYGGNGSGKTTALNVIAEKLSLNRESLYNRSPFFENYTGLCDYMAERIIPEESRIITSDDVFNFMLDIRVLMGNRQKAGRFIHRISGTERYEKKEVSAAFAG